MVFFKESSSLNLEFPIWIKISVPIVVSLALVSFLFLGVHIPSDHEMMLKQKKASLKEITQVAMSVLVDLQNQVEKKTISSGEAKKKAVTILPKFVNI